MIHFYSSKLNKEQSDYTRLTGRGDTDFLSWLIVNVGVDNYKIESNFDDKGIHLGWTMDLDENDLFRFKLRWG